MSDFDDDGLVLNLAAIPQGPTASRSRTQQRKMRWTQQRAIKRQKQKFVGYMGGGSGQQGSQQQGMGASDGGGQLKGYSLDDYEPEPLPAPKHVQQPVEQQQPANEQKQQPEQPPRQQQPEAAPKQQPQKKQQQEKAQRPPAKEDVQPIQQVTAQPAIGHQGPGQEPAGQQSLDPPPSGARLAAQHLQRHLQRSRGRRGGSPQPGCTKSGATAGAGAKEEGGEADAEELRRIGKLRLASRKAGYREPTPDLDEVGAAGSDADSEDVNAAVAAAVARDKAVQAELAAAQSRSRKQGRAMRQAESEAEEEEEAEAERGSGRVVAKAGTAGTAGATRRLAGMKDLGRFGGSSSEDEGLEAGAGVVVDFGVDYAAEEAAQRRRNKRRNKEKEAAAAAAAEGGTGGGSAAGSNRAKAGGKAQAAWAGVLPGELVHAGGGVGEAAKQGHQTGGGSTEGGSGSSSGGFAALGLSQQLADHLAAHSFGQPTLVQRQSIPVLLALIPLQSGRDALVNAPTGSGKTLSYLAPIVHDLASQQPPITRSRGTLALVVCPTRELCLQVADVLAMLVRRFVWLVGGAIHGGEDRGKEKARLRKGVTVVVATPGRLLDHLENTQAFRTEELRWLVLDEADRLLDLGFEKKIEAICSLLDSRSAEADYASRRTTALLSATLHSNLGSLASLSLRDPASIGFDSKAEEGQGVAVLKQPSSALTAKGGSEAWAAAAEAAATAAAGPGNTRSVALEQFQIPAQLKQRFVEVPCKLRLVALGAVLRARMAANPSSCKAVVFLSTTDSVEFYHAVLADAWEPATGERLLQQASAPILKLHGNMAQSERTAAFLRFARCPAGVLLCTDVAARGLDFPAVTDIVQFDPPGEAAEYVHRVGRTARLGHKGDALLFLMPSEREYVHHLEAHGVRLQEQPAAPLLNAVLGKDRKAGSLLPLERHQGGYALQKQLMEGVAADTHLARLGADAFRSWVRAYATHSSSVKHVFHVRRLHLGHVAHAFALLERPSLVGKSSTKQASQQKRKAQHAQHGQQAQRSKQPSQPQQQSQPQRQPQQQRQGGGSGGGGKQARRQPPPQLASTGGGMYTLT